MPRHPFLLPSKNKSHNFTKLTLHLSHLVTHLKLFNLANQSIMKNVLLIFALLSSCLMLGCGSEESPQGEKNTPGNTATLYFDALYNQNDLNQAMEYATPKMARIMKSYGTANQFARNLINMQYDKVVIEVDMTNMSLREQYGDKANINLIFTGYFNGKKVDDMRSVKMIRKKGNWYIEKINADPFAR